MVHRHIQKLADLRSHICSSLQKRSKSLADLLLGLLLSLFAFSNVHIFIINSLLTNLPKNIACQQHEDICEPVTATQATRNGTVLSQLWWEQSMGCHPNGQLTVGQSPHRLHKVRAYGAS